MKLKTCTEALFASLRRFKMNSYQVRIREINNRYMVKLLNVGCTYFFADIETAKKFKQTFDGLKIEKGSSVHNCRKNARKAFWGIKEQMCNGCS